MCRLATISYIILYESLFVCLLLLLLLLQLLIVRYDPQYALRLCTEHRLTKACVLIYAAMGLYEESVDYALEVITILYSHTMYIVAS